MKHPTRRELAKIVRSKCEAYVTEDKLNEFDHDLSCMCAIASTALFESFKQYGYNAEICVWDGEYGSHAFVLSGGMIYDITATQFDPKAPKVLIESYNDKKPHFDAEEYIGYDPVEGKESRIWYTKDLKVFAKWPPEQKPRLGLVKKLSVTA